VGIIARAFLFFSSVASLLVRVRVSAVAAAVAARHDAISPHRGKLVFRTRGL